MAVIDMQGNVLKTHCFYDEKEERIIIFPIDPYEENKYYILTISSNLYSHKGKKLKKPINIMFKLKA